MTSIITQHLRYVGHVKPHNGLQRTGMGAWFPEGGTGVTNAEVDTGHSRNLMRVSARGRGSGTIREYFRHNSARGGGTQNLRVF